MVAQVVGGCERKSRGELLIQLQRETILQTHKESYFLKITLKIQNLNLGGSG